MKTAKTVKVSKHLRQRVESAIYSVIKDELEPTTRTIRDRMKSIDGVSISQETLLLAARPWREKHNRTARAAAVAFHNLDAIQRREFYRVLREKVPNLKEKR